MGLIKNVLLFEKHTCPWWLAYSWDHRLRRLIHDSRRILKPHLSKGDSVADIGCGMGYFSIAMADYVGASGKVFAVDIQQKMLDILTARSSNPHVRPQIKTILAGREADNIDRALDFMLMFWMLHEVEDRECFLKNWHSCLKPGGKYLLVEPRIHVSANRFDREVDLCRHVGFEAISHPRVRVSRCVLFRKTKSE